MNQKLLLAVSFLLICCSFVIGQEAENRLKLSTPHDAIWVHLYYLQSEQYQPEISASAFVGDDLELRKKQAIRLKQVLDGKGLYVQMNLLPRETDYLDSVSNKPYYTPFPNELPEIYLEKIDSQWHYSAESAEEISDLYKAVYPMGTHRLVSLFSQIGKNEFLGVSFWQLVGLLILIGQSVLLYFVFAWILRRLINRLSNSISYIEQYADHVQKMAKLSSLYFIVWIAKLFFPLLQFHAKVNSVVQVMLDILLTVILTLLALRAVKFFGSRLKYATSKTESRMDDQIVPLLLQILKIIVVLLSFLRILQLLNFNVTALIAGVSIGGLALALAAQDTVKNFLGSVMIFADKPFQIGDWVEGDGFVGTVVEVGFRSTRIRTSDTSIISVPNGNMANISVVNKGARKFRLYATTLGITYDSPADLIEFFMEGIKEIIQRHPEVAPEDQYVSFSDLGSSSLNIFVRCYMIAPTYADELRIKESLNLQMVRWAETAGVRFAFPTTTVFVEETPGLESLTPKHDLGKEKKKAQWERYFGAAEDSSRDIADL